MHDQPTPSPGERMDRADKDLLSTLSSDESHRPWSVDELARQLGEDPTAALARLSREGLIHRLGDFAWAARPAVRAQELHNA
jgi:predicted transcriptional regulator